LENQMDNSILITRGLQSVEQGLVSPRLMFCQTSRF
jgi:hypothetical protein